VADLVMIPIGPRGWTGAICGQWVQSSETYLGVDELARIFGRSLSAIRNRCRDGVLPAVKVNGRWQVRASAIGRVELSGRACGGAIVRRDGAIACTTCGHVPDWARDATSFGPD